MRALLVDDERLARVELRRLLAAFPSVELVGEAANVEEARERIAALQPDLLFLDIEMPGGSGFDLLASLEEAPAVIFTTAYDAHAVKAFEVNALDYLLKPIEPARLAAALERVRVRVKPAVAPEGPPPGGYLEQVFVKDGERCWLVRLDEVPLFQSEGNYARLYLDGAQPLLGRSLNHLEERLDPKRFFRASRRHLVNLRFVDRIEPMGAQLILHVRGGGEVEMSRRQSQKFRARMEA